MRGIAAVLLCLISLHYLTVIDVYAASFTSENGMPGREHEDKHPRRSTNVKRSLSETVRQEPDYNWENYGGIPNIPGYIDRDAYSDTELDAYEDGDQNSLPRPSRRLLNPEDQRQRRSVGAKRTLSESVRQEPDYNWENYGGIPNIPGYIDRDAYSDTELDAYEDGDQNSLPRPSRRLLTSEDQRPRRSAGAKRTLSESPDKTMRQGDYYDNWENYGGIPNIPIAYYNRDESIDVDAGADADKNSFSKTLRRLLSPVVDAVRQLWGKLSGKSLESVGAGDTKRQNASNGPQKKRAMESRKDEDRGSTNPEKRKIVNPIGYLTDLAKKALDFAYNIIKKIDVSQLTEETKKLKEAVLEILQKAKDSLEKLLDKVDSAVDSPYSRRTRSVGKRKNARDALESYLTGLKSQKRSKTRNSFRRSGNTSARASDMTALMDLMAEMEQCIQKIPATNTSRLGVECIVLPLVKALASPKLGGASGLTMDADSNVRSDALESPYNLRRLNFPWGSIFLIPMYNGKPPEDHVPPSFDHGSDNVTTTTTTTTTTEPPTTTTEAQTIPIYDEPDKEVRSGSKYRSRYDKDY